MWGGEACVNSCALRGIGTSQRLVDFNSRCAVFLSLSRFGGDCRELIPDNAGLWPRRASILSHRPRTLLHLDRLNDA